IGAIAPDIKSAIDTVKGLIATGQKIIDAIQNADQYFQKGREWAANKLTDLAMGLFEPPLKQLVGALTGFAVKLLKNLVTTPVTAMVTSAIASVTMGIGALAAPVIKMGIDKFVDWGIDQVKELLAGLVMGISLVRDFLHDRIIAPIINDL